MISRIVSLILLSTPLFAGELITDLGETRVLSVNLANPLPPTTITAAESALTAEEKAPNLTATRKAEIALARGLIALAKGEHARAIDFFDHVPLDYILRDAALFYRATAQRLQGENLLKIKRAADAIKVCREARKSLDELMDQPGSFYPALQPEERRQATLCYVRALAAEHQIAEVKPILFTLLKTTTNSEESERQLLRQVAHQVIQEDKSQDPEALDFRRAFLDQGLRIFPDDYALKSAMDQLPKLIAASLPPAAKGQLPGAKPRSLPEDALLREAAGLVASRQPKKAVDIYLKIFKEYPGSLAAAKAGAKLQVMVENDLNKEKRPPTFLNELKKLPTKVAYNIARSMWEKDFAAPAYEMFEEIAKEDPTAPETGNVLFFMGRIHEDQNEWEVARKQFERVATAYSASTFFERAHSKVGWLSYLLNDNAKALEWMEYDRALADTPARKAEDLYWISKVYEKMGKPEQAKKYVQEIGLIAPVSYYAVLTDQLPNFVDGQAGSFTSVDAWNRFRLRRARGFLAVGLPAAAAESLGQIDASNDLGAAREVATLLPAARQFGAGMIVASRLITRFSETTIPRDIANAFFPVQYEEMIYPEAQVNKLDPLLLFALIKQESAYREDAESRAGALGLMQLMPQTARDVAQEMKTAAPERADLLMSDKNVKIGAKYLASLLKQYEGNLAYALACYNAGPQRVNAWKKRWGNLPTEQFIELIPFEETRNYVKSIIRNYAYYAKLLENRKIDLKTAPMVPQT